MVARSHPADADVDDEPMRAASVAPFFVVFGGVMFMAIGLVTALTAYSDAAEVAGYTTTDRLLVATQPLTLAAVGLLSVAAGLVLATVDRGTVSTRRLSPLLAALRAHQNDE